MDVGQPWTCAACGAGNAGYRKRCIDCGGTSATQAVLAEPEEQADASSLGAVEITDIPMPSVARRPRRRLGRGAAAMFTAAVLALASYGAVTYFGADRPSSADDRAALEAAAPEVFDGAVVVAEVLGLPDDLLASSDRACLDAATDLLRLLDVHATVSLEISSSVGQIAMHVFDTRPAAIRFDDGLRAAALDGCAPDLADRHYVVTGRARVEVRGVDGAEADALLARFVERLEIEG